MLTLLRSFPPEEPTKKRFVGEIVGWSSKFGDYPAGDPELHHVAGTLYAEGRSRFLLIELLTVALSND